jgi:hypothetical protein
MRISELFEDEKLPLVWTMVDKILKSGGSVKAYLKTWNNETSKNNPAGFYSISAVTDETTNGDGYRFYYINGGSSFGNWFELTHQDDSHVTLKKQTDGAYHLINREGRAIVV